MKSPAGSHLVFVPTCHILWRFCPKREVTLNSSLSGGDLQFLCKPENKLVVDAQCGAAVEAAAVTLKCKCATVWFGSFCAAVG